MFLLITRPEFDEATFYLSKWSIPIIDEANKKSIDVIDLDKKKANRSKFIGILNKIKPRLVVLNGHGSSEFVCGHNNELILGIKDKEVKSKIIFARACDSAAVLGKKTIKYGATAYIGYKAPFVFEADTHNTKKDSLKDNILAVFLKPSNYLVISLLKGHSVKDSYDRSIKEYKRSIEKQILTDTNHVKYLWWNMNSQIYFGDENARI